MNFQEDNFISKFRETHVGGGLDDGSLEPKKGKDKMKTIIRRIAEQSATVSESLRKF